jgi:transposase
MKSRMCRSISSAAAYHPATLLKVYLYGHPNRVESIRELERETQHNIELMWLTARFDA